MPKINSNSSPSSSDLDIKPYARSSSPLTPTKTKKAAIPWSPEDRVKLFEAAISKGVSMKAFEGVVEGRSGKQCYDIWVCVVLSRTTGGKLMGSKTVAPAIKRSLSGAK